MAFTTSVWRSFAIKLTSVKTSLYKVWVIVFRDSEHLHHVWPKYSLIKVNFYFRNKCLPGLSILQCYDASGLTIDSEKELWRCPLYHPLTKLFSVQLVTRVSGAGAERIARCLNNIANIIKSSDENTRCW